MAFLRLTGSERKTLPNKIAKKASVAMSPGYAVIGTSGQVDVATSSAPSIASAGTNFLGIATQTIASTDTDYASTTPVVVEQIDPTAVYLADSTSTAVATTTALIGSFVDLTDAGTVNPGGSTTKAVKIVGVIDATHLLVTFNPNLL